MSFEVKKYYDEILKNINMDNQIITSIEFEDS